MKKISAISLLLLMIIAMLHISIAEHYCGGKEAASIVSLTGKLADCGMESTKKGLPLSGTNFTEQCCNNVVTNCAIYSNYEPPCSFVPESFQSNLHHFALPAGFSVNSNTNLIPLYTNVSPPGVLVYTCVDLSDICVFRI